MSVDVFIANSHRWLHDELIQRAMFESRVARIVETRRGADLLIYLDPPWPDPDAPDRLRTFRPRHILRTFVYSQADRPIAWAPGMYASPPRSQGETSFVGGFYVPHHHAETGGLASDLEAARAIEPTLLWSFMGTHSTHPVRRRLQAIRDPEGIVRDTQQFSDVVRWGWQSTQRVQGRAAFGEYATTIGRSNFVLCPRGVGSSTIRLFEALQVGRCPVVISDEWLPPPFVDWGSCSLQVPESAVEDLPQVLRERVSDAGVLGREARAVWERFFSPQQRLRTLVEGCVTLEDEWAARISLLTAGVVQAAARGSRQVVRRMARAPG